MIDKIVWQGGWPEVGDGSPSSTWPQQPRIDLPARVTLVGAGAGVPAEGGTITATMTVTAPAGSGYSGLAWAEVVSPNGTRTPVPLGATSIALAPGESRDLPITVNISGTALVGTHEVIGYVGASTAAPSDFGVVRVAKARGNLDPPPAPNPGSLSGSLGL